MHSPDGDLLCSNTRNSDTVAIEVCHPDETGKFSAVTYDRVVELTAWLCREFRLKPEKDVIRHYDVSGKSAPNILWRTGGLGTVSGGCVLGGYWRRKLKNLAAGETKPPSKSSY